MRNGEERGFIIAAEFKADNALLRELKAEIKKLAALVARTVSAIAEELKELRSEKALILQRFEYAEEAGAEAFRKDIATMEAGLKKLEAQEQKTLPS